MSTGVIVRSILALATTTLAAAGDSAHWAFQPIAESPIPTVSDPGWIANPIDAFVLARLEAAGLAPSPQAPTHALLRRLHLDLTGLLPTPAERAEFQAAWGRNPESAYLAKVQQLLDSPHFGERWGRHWLDLARYADSDGYLGDNLRNGAWLYRDWVIDAINRDQPFDRFSIEQLAGDLLPDATIDQKTAAGFHRNSLKNTEAGADRELARTKQVVDRVAATGTTWLGLTLGCAECHDHKHDPVSQREFYQLFAFFNNTNDADYPVRIEADWQAYEAQKKAWEARPAAEKDAKPPSEPSTKVQSYVELGQTARRASFVHIRGDYARPGDAVSPGVPAVLHEFEPGENPNRLALANWLFEPENPLTARVAANQIWQQLLGVGIVASPDDFGTHGDRPTHPELLDWLATEFRRNGWSRKELIRTIVTSSTYRQSSVNSRPETPNQLLWRQNSFRVSAETVRDIHLAASGLLAPKLGGPGIRPPLPEFITEVGRTVKWPVSEGAERYRRGLYIFLKRTVLYPMLTSFDAPDTSVSCSRRERTNTPMQALTLLNDPVFFECAEALGRDLHSKHGEAAEAAIADLFARCLNRAASPDETATLTKAYADLKQAAGDPELAMIATARIVMNLDEFVTRD